MRDRNGERADTEVVSEAIAEFYESRPGWTCSELAADYSTWRRRFLRCAELARVRERRRIGRALGLLGEDDA